MWTKFFSTVCCNEAKKGTGDLNRRRAAPYKAMLDISKNPAILSFFFDTEKAELNAAHAQLLEKLRVIAFAELADF